MRRLFAFTSAFLIVNTMLFSVGAGFYVPDRLDYMTAEGTAYSREENNAASITYPVGTILDITGADGKSATVYVNDRMEMPPDREILLNLKAAESLGMINSGYEDLKIEVILSADDESSEENQGWYKYMLTSPKTNEEALVLYNTLAENGLRPFAVLNESVIDMYVRYIPQYQTSQVETLLESLGYPEAVRMDEENPYL